MSHIKYPTLAFCSVLLFLLESALGLNSCEESLSYLLDHASVHPDPLIPVDFLFTPDKNLTELLYSLPGRDRPTEEGKEKNKNGAVMNIIDFPKEKYLGHNSVVFTAKHPDGELPEEKDGAKGRIDCVTEKCKVAISKVMVHWDGQTLSCLEDRDGPYISQNSDAQTEVIVPWKRIYKTFDAKNVLNFLIRLEQPTTTYLWKLKEAKLEDNTITFVTEYGASFTVPLPKRVTKVKREYYQAGLDFVATGKWKMIFTEIPDKAIPAEAEARGIDLKTFRSQVLPRHFTFAPIVKH